MTTTTLQTPAFVCSCCGNVGAALPGSLSSGQLSACVACAHMMVFDGRGFRDLRKDELADESNAETFEAARRDQEELCRELKFWG